MFLAVSQLPCSWILGGVSDLPGFAMADAWAAGSHAGIGGWWTWETAVSPNTVHWFHLPISVKSLPAYWHVPGADLSKVIATLELVAQLVLLKGRLATAPQETRAAPCRASFQFSDNSRVVAATGKWLTMKSPLDKALQAVGWHCHLDAMVPAVSHVAGVRNEMADLLSHRNDASKAAEVAALMSVMDPKKEWTGIHLEEWLDRPWRRHTDPCVRKRRR